MFLFDYKNIERCFSIFHFVFFDSVEKQGSQSLHIFFLCDVVTDPDAHLRRDFTKIPVFTIDDESRHEVDDGVSVITDDHEDEWLYIHIADPTRYIHPQSHLDLLARERVSSIFLPDLTFHLFPPVLSKKLFSLLPKKKTPVLSFGVKLAPDGSVERYHIVPAVIEKVISLTYEELDSILFRQPNTANAKAVQSEYLPLITKLEQFAKLRRLYRLERKAILSHIPRPEIRVTRIVGNEAVVKLSVSSDSNKNSRGIVSEFMLLAGEIAADFCTQKNVCAIYRTQPAPFTHNAASLSKKYNTKNLQEFLLGDNLISEERSLPKQSSYILEQVEQTKTAAPTVLSVTRAPHHGLGLTGYCQVTSPIRRYIDLINHYQLKAALRNYIVAPFSPQTLHQLLPELNERIAEIQQLQRQSERFWVLKYIEEQYNRDNKNNNHSPRTTYRAVVISNTPQTDVVVMILKFGLQTKIVSKRPLQKGEIIQLYVDYVDPFYDILILKEKENISTRQ
jgi:exoribonuclease-2